MWLERAATLAVGRYEIDDALVMLERALELEDDPQRQGRLWRLVGKANALRHDGDPFLDAMMRAIELASTDDERAELYAELCFETATRSGMWRRRPGRDLVDGWIAHALGPLRGGQRLPCACPDRALCLGPRRLAAACAGGEHDR